MFLGLGVHITNSAIYGRKLGTELDISDFGNVSGANAAPAIQSMLNSLGYFKLPVGIFTIQDPIVIPGGSYGTLFRGLGSEQSIIRANGMAGASAVSFETGYYRRVTMMDFSIDGDADTALNLSVGSGYNLYTSSFERLNLSSINGPCIISDYMFSTNLYRIDASSILSNAFDLPGGNTVTLINCYAHYCGATSAGFRIKGGATLIGCNGVDTRGDSHYWGHFGNSGVYYNINLNGCNLEDFGNAAILLDGIGGKMSINGCGFTAPSTGTYHCIIKTPDGYTTSDAHLLKIDHSSNVSSKGATRSGPSNICLYGWQHVLVESNSLSSASSPGSFPDAYKTAVSLLYPTMWKSQHASAYQIVSRRIPNAFNDALWVKERHAVVTTFTENSQTPSINGYNTVKTNNTSSTTVNSISGVEEGKEITVLVKDAYTTFKHNYGGSGSITLSSGADYAALNGDVLKFVCNGTTWVQI